MADLLDWNAPDIIVVLFGLGVLVLFAYGGSLGVRDLIRWRRRRRLTVYRGDYYGRPCRICGAFIGQPCREHHQ